MTATERNFWQDQLSVKNLGQLDEAREQARELMRQHPNFTIGRWRHRPPYRDAAFVERFVDALRQAGLPD